MAGHKGSRASHQVSYTFFIFTQMTLYAWLFHICELSNHRSTRVHNKNRVHTEHVQTFSCHCLCTCVHMCMYVYAHTHIWESEDYLQLFETKMLTAELVLNSPHMLEKGASESPGLHLSPSPQHWDSKFLPSYLVFNVSSGNPIHVFVLSTLNPRSLPTKLSTPALLSKTNC